MAHNLDMVKKLERRSNQKSLIQVVVSSFDFV